MRTIIESPYAGDVNVNLMYLRRCCRHSIDLGEHPFASHLFYTQFLDDDVKEERKAGMEAGFDWMSQAEQVVVYIDLGISNGMKKGIEKAQSVNLPVSYRSLVASQEYVDAIMSKSETVREEALSIIGKGVKEILKIQIEAVDEMQEKMNNSLESFGLGRPVKIKLS